MTDFVSTGDLALFMETDGLSEPIARLAVAAAQASVRKYVDQEITLVEDDVLGADGTATAVLRLPERPVRAVASVQANGAEVTAFTRRRSLLIRTDGKVWPRGRGNVEVTYSHGWDVGADLLDSDSDSDSAGDLLTVPADIVLVTLCVARRAYQSAGIDDPAAVVSETVGAYASTFTPVAELVKLEERALRRYKIVGSG